MHEDDASKSAGQSEGIGADATATASLKRKAVKFSKDAMSVAGKTATLVGDLNGDGKVDEEDAKIARDRMASVLAAGADEAGQLAKSVARSSLTKDVASYAAIGAAVALPLPVVGPAIGAAVGAGLGLFRNLKRTAPDAPETAMPPKDKFEELERLGAMREKGLLTEEEFAAQKRKLLK
ncbi:SHOCT domain-containing protein [Novosphingobium sp.]|uniref:SHOCT domain-containing protein n=1 Tax=Novosphingobium sp. TaxID=1874826 RepID=UPI0035B21148